MENAKDGTEGMVIEEVLSNASVHDASDNVECLGDSGPLGMCATTWV